jgi:hypothetical protein
MSEYFAAGARRLERPGARAACAVLIRADFLNSIRTEGAVRFFMPMRRHNFFFLKDFP